MDKQKIIFWVIWLAMLQSVIVIQFVLGKGVLGAVDSDGSPLVFMALPVGMIVVASLVRWIYVPRRQRYNKLLVLMIIGLALSEGAEMVSLFMLGPRFPEQQFSIFVLSLLSVIQFAPVFLPQESR